MKDILLTGVKWMMWTIRYCTSRCETRGRRRRRLRKGERKKEEEGGVNGAFMLTGRSFLAEGGGGWVQASVCWMEGSSGPVELTSGHPHRRENTTLSLASEAAATGFPGSTY